MKVAQLSAKYMSTSRQLGKPYPLFRNQKRDRSSVNKECKPNARCFYVSNNKPSPRREQTDELIPYHDLVWYVKRRVTPFVTYSTAGRFAYEACCIYAAVRPRPGQTVFWWRSNPRYAVYRPS